jgi:vacuolar protein 8
VEIVQYNGLAPLLRLLKSSFLPLILSSVACVRNISIHPANESPIIQEGFVHPLIELLSFDENEEVQCHAISTLRNLAASSERNKRTIVEAGAVERIKQLIHQVPVSVRTEMTAAVAVLALSDELKPKLLTMNVLDVLIPATLEKKHVEVQGNAAAAIGNLSSKIKDYSPFVKVWDAGEVGLKAFLTTFLNDTSDIAFQHIGVWTIEQFLDGESKFFIYKKERDANSAHVDKELTQKLVECDEIQASIARIANAKQSETERDIYSLARKVLNTMDQFKEKPLGEEEAPENK